MNGKHQLVRLEIKPEVVDPEDVEMLCDMLTAAFNEALRKVDEADRKNLTVLQFENEVDCFSGFMYAVYATVCKDTECPYTCALFINYLLSEEGFAGEKSWNSSQGYYSPNKTIQKPEGLEDQPYEYWTDKLVFEDLQYIYDHYIDVYEFIATRVG